MEAWVDAGRALVLAVGGFLMVLPLVRLLIWKPLLDKPDGTRKLQARPVPTAGGAAIALVTLLVVGAQMAGRADVAAFWALPLFCALLGAVDDRFGLGSIVKTLALGAACALAAVYLGQVAGPVSTPFGAWFGEPWLNMAGSALFLFVTINIFNFMDGSNGMLGVFSLVLLAGLSAVSGGPELAPLMAGGVAAFLWFNLPGRIYAGDVGSLFLGAVISQGALGLARADDIGGIGVWVAAICLLPFLMDGLLTLGWRTVKGRPLLKAHRDHAYQRLIDRLGWSHVQVAALYGALTLVCVAIAVVAAMQSGGMPFWAFMGVVVVMTLLWAAVLRHRPVSSPATP